ncbi:MAG: hypothetical protein ACR2RL_22510 [Gammaproteobacteria bacterium]
MSTVEPNGYPAGGPTRVEIVADDGIPLSATVFEPSGETNVTALFTGGMGVPQRVRRHLAAWLLLVDHTGHFGVIRRGHLLPVWAEISEFLLDGASHPHSACGPR